MEAPSAHEHAGRVPWTEILLAASLCISWVPPTTGNFCSEPRIHHSITYPFMMLKLDQIPSPVLRYVWYRGNNRNPNNRIASYVARSRTTIPGPAHTGREKLYPTAVMKIENITREDTGYYTMEAVQTNNKTVTASIYVLVVEPLQSNVLRQFISIVQENDNVSIFCLTPELGYKINWFRNDRQVKEKYNVKFSAMNYMLNIRHIKKEDAGKYQCKFWKNTRRRASEPVRIEIV